jgi:demethylmenaquinone methyltransferase/2-methoxy-6-polyprenyl-1,4-benzoquinol methylase
VRFDDYGYGAVAPFYEELADLYSRGRIAASKRSQLGYLTAGDRVLYVGVGRGEDALEAARKGVRVTAVDLSEAMLRRLAQRLEREGLDAELVEADIAELPRTESYDVVVANYFLNLFEPGRAQQMLALLVERVRPGGLVCCADFARPVGGRSGRWASELYYRPVNWIAWLLGLCDLHPIHDYVRMFESVGLRVLDDERLPVWHRATDPAFMSIVAERAV